MALGCSAGSNTTLCSLSRLVVAARGMKTKRRRVCQAIRGTHDEFALIHHGIIAAVSSGARPRPGRPRTTDEHRPRSDRFRLGRIRRPPGCDQRHRAGDAGRSAVRPRHPGRGRQPARSFSTSAVGVLDRRPGRSGHRGPCGRPGRAGPTRTRGRPGAPGPGDGDASRTRSHGHRGHHDREARAERCRRGSSRSAFGHSLVRRCITPGRSLGSSRSTRQPHASGRIRSGVRSGTRRTSWASPYAALMRDAGRPVWTPPSASSGNRASPRAKRVCGR